MGKEGFGAVEIGHDLAVSFKKDKYPIDWS